MGSLSIWHWVVVLVVVLLLFGKGKIPALMGDLAKGINAFNKRFAPVVIRLMIFIRETC